MSLIAMISFASCPTKQQAPFKWRHNHIPLIAALPATFIFPFFYSSSRKTPTDTRGSRTLPLTTSIIQHLGIAERDMTSCSSTTGSRLIISPTSLLLTTPHPPSLTAPTLATILMPMKVIDWLVTKFLTSLYICGPKGDRSLMEKFMMAAM